MPQPNVKAFVPAPTAAPAQTGAVWPDSNDVADLLAIVQAQTQTMADQALLISRYQTTLNNAQVQSSQLTAVGTGMASGTPPTSLAVTGVTNTIVIGATVAGAGVPSNPPVTIVSQQSGTTGWAGTYITSAGTSANNALLTFTPPPAASAWPTPRDQATLNTLTQQQVAVVRTQNALIQHYQDVLNTSQTPAA